MDNGIAGNSGTPNFARQRTRLAAQERQARVFEFVILKGLSEASVAKHLNVCRNTVVADVKALRDQMRARARDLDGLCEIGEMLTKLDRISQDANLEAAAAQSPAAKAMLVGQSLRALELKAKLLSNTGLIPKAEQRVSATLELSNGIDVRSMSTPELKAYRQALVERLVRETQVN